MRDDADFDRAIWSGSRYIDVVNPRAEDIDLHEVALNLAHETRFSRSATRVHWTVGQHSLFCLDLARPDMSLSARDLLAILLHDGPEYLLRDFYAPFKRQCPDYSRLEDRWWAAFADKFDLPEVLPEVVKKYDWLALCSEKAALLSPKAGRWAGEVLPRPVPNYLLEMTAEDVAREYEHRARRLQQEAKFRAGAGVNSVSSACG